MAIGGMIGGGIFSVLGVTVDLAGHLAFGCFVLGGVIALITARSYAVLSVRAGRSGGPFLYLHDAGSSELGAVTAWLLILGYVIALAVYSFTFGHYFANILGAPDVVARVASVGVLVVFFGINLRGVGASALTEDAVVFTKLIVLCGIAAVGVSSFLGASTVAVGGPRHRVGSFSEPRRSSSRTKASNFWRTTTTTSKIPSGRCHGQCICRSSWWLPSTSS